MNAVISMYSDTELIVGDTNLISGLSKTRIEALTDGIFAIAMPAHACRRGAVRGQPRMQSVLVFVPDAVSGALLNVKTMVQEDPIQCGGQNVADHDETRARGVSGRCSHRHH